MVLGGVIGGGTVPALAQSFGWAPVIWVLAGLIALTGLAGRALGDTKNLTPPEHVTLRGGARVFLFSEGRFLLAAVALIASTGAVDMTLAARLVDAGFSPERAAIILGTIATILMTPATLFAGYAVSRWNPASCFAAIGLSKAAILAALSLLQQSSGILIATLAVAEFVCAGALTVMTWQFYMARVDSKSGLTGFALLTSTDALFRLGLGIGAGLLGAAIGMGALFLTVAGLNLLTAIYIVRIWRQNA